MKPLFPVAILLLVLGFCCNLSERFLQKSPPDSAPNSTTEESTETAAKDSETTVTPTKEKPELTLPPKSVGLAYKPYVNTRFGYRVEYPFKLLKPQGEAPNQDGQIFRSSDAEMRVFGSNMLSNGNLREEYAALLKEKRGSASYKVLRGKFFVISGEQNGKIYYQKTFINGSDAFITFMIEYPVSKRKTYDKVVTRVVKSFK